MNSHDMFHLACSLFKNEPLDDNIRMNLEQVLPQQCLFFLIANNRFLHPLDLTLVHPETIWETLRNDRAVIFCRRMTSHDFYGNNEYMLCAAHLGKNGRDEDVAAGIIYSERWGRARDYADSFADIVASFKRYYADFTGSRTISEYFNNESCFRYLVEAQTKELVARRAPDSEVASADIAHYDDLFKNGLLKSELNRFETESTPVIFDRRLKNFNISRFRLDCHEYLLLSFRLTGAAEDKPETADRAVRDYSHQMRNKLSAIETAASQLSLKKGRILDDEDNSLIDIILTAADSLNALIEEMQPSQQPEKKETGIAPGLANLRRRHLEIFVDDQDSMPPGSKSSPKEATLAAR